MKCNKVINEELMLLISNAGFFSQEFDKKIKIWLAMNPKYYLREFFSMILLVSGRFLVISALLLSFEQLLGIIWVQI